MVSPTASHGVWLVFDAQHADGLDGIAAGDAVLVLTWLDRAARVFARAAMLRTVDER